MRQLASSRSFALFFFKQVFDAINFTRERRGVAAATETRKHFLRRLELTGTYLGKGSRRTLLFFESVLRGTLLRAPSFRQL